MINFIDETGKQYSAIVECKKTKGVNGEKSLTGTIYTNDEILEGIGRGWRLQFQGEMYCLTFVHPIDEGDRIVVEFDAVHEFFFDFSKSIIYRELNGSNTMTAYLDFIFSGSGYDYRLEVDVNAFEKQNFGMKNRLTLFKDIISSTGLEFSVNGKVVRILQEVGTDLSTIVKKGFNLNQLNIEKDAGSFITYKRGYGAYFDEDDHSKGRLTVEYLSPLAEIYGKLEGEPVIDERYKVADNLRTRLQKDVEESYGISAEIDMEDLTKAGYSYEQPHEGDYIMAINDDLGFRQKIRIMLYVTEFDTEENIIKHDVSCGSANLVSKVSSAENDFKDQVQADLENAVNNANSAMIAANGKNKVFTGPDEPTATAIGDIWYHEIGEETIMKYWNGFEWMPFINPNKIQEAIAETEKGVSDAKNSANTALEKADQAISEAGFANNTATTAKDIATLANTTADNANQTANQAKTDAGTALGNSQTAISNAQSALNQSDLAKSQAEEAINKYLGMGMSPAWSWSADGTDRFTAVYPGENVFLRSDARGFTSRGITAVFDKETGIVTVTGTTTEAGDLWGVRGNAKDYNPAGKYTYSAEIIEGTFPTGIGLHVAIYVNGKWSQNHSNNGSPILKFTASGGVRDLGFRSYAAGIAVNFKARMKLENGYNDSPIYTPSPSEDYANAVPSYIGFAIEPSDNPADYTWMRNPEKVEGEVKVELTEINGELSRKVSQETFNVLNGTVTNQSTLISQNQIDIKAKADQTLVDTINKTVTDNSAAIGVNATAITQKANQTTVDTLTGRVTKAEGSITTIAGQVDLKANKTDVNALSNTVTSLSGELSVQAGKITALNTKTDGHTTQIGNLQTSYNGLSSTVSKVESDLDGLSVGGKNLLTGTDFTSTNPAFKSRNNYAVINFADSETPFSSGQKSMKVVAAAAGVYGTDLEWTTKKPDRVDVGQKWVTLSFYAKFSVATLFKVRWGYGDYAPAVQIGITWKRYTITFPVSSVHGTALHPLFTNAGTAYFFQMKLEYGNKATDWTPAPEDMATVTEMSNLTQTVNTIQSTVADKADKSQITQLAADINLRVQKGELLSQINLEAGQALIQTGKLYLDAATVQFSGQAFIPSASIVNLSADKINTGTLNASIVNVTNMNASNITTGTLNANRIGSKTITADKINVTSLSAIVANLGTVTAGTLNSVNINAAVMNGGEIISPLFKFPSMSFHTPNSSFGDTVSKGKMTPKGFFMVSQTFHSIDGQLEYIDMLTITSLSVTVEQWSATNNQTKRSAYGFSGTAHTTTYSGKPTNYTYAINMTA